MLLKALIHGGTGRLGSEIAKLAPLYGIEVIEALGRGGALRDHIELSEVVIDTSVHTATVRVAEVCAEYNKPLIIGTTGHTEEEMKKIKGFSKDIPILIAPNFSIAVNLLIHLTKQAAGCLDESFEPEIIEIHHSKKKDAPSGTAKALSRAVIEGRDLHGRLGGEIGIHSLRSGDTVGEHTIIFSGQGERLELVHRCTDRKIFAHGALKATLWIVQQAPSLYGMEHISLFSKFNKT